MSTPTPPQIFIRPGAYNNAVDMWWRAPLSTGGYDISGYTLTCLDQTFSTLYFASGIKEAYVTGLTAGLPYTSQPSHHKV